jgi:putative MATE family efflux protein
MTVAEAPAGRHARFVTGSTMGHVVVMTLTGAVGLMSVFLVDLADLYFLSLLGETAITAAIGFAGTIAFASLSISIGLGIGAAALVARHVGARDERRAREFATTALFASTALVAVVALASALLATPALRLLGAEGQVLAHARSYVVIVALGFPLLAGAICSSFCLRAIGDPRRAMYVTLSAAAINGCLDPLFIFGLDMGIRGAATATVLADLAALALGLNGLARVQRFLVHRRPAAMLKDLGPLAAIAMPAVMTQLATPFAVAYMTRAAAPFGDEAVAAVAIINRLVPVAFGLVFSLSGAIGPIIGQNFGAGEMGRVRRSLRDAMLLSTFYTLTTAAILLLLRHHIPPLFRAQGETVALVAFYCTFLAAAWAFTGAQFVAQAAFNNLGRPHWSTFANWGRATLGTIPFVHAGAVLDGARGVLIGSAVGAALFGLGATVACFRLVARLERDDGRARPASAAPTQAP